MKKLKNVLLPAVIVLMGAGAAFATNGAKSTIDATESGSYINSSNVCVESNYKCSSTPGTTCMWEDESGTSHKLFRNGTNCTVQLARVP